jgi:hypothetical protein
VDQHIAKTRKGFANVHDSLREHAGVGTHHADLESLGDPPDSVGVLGEEVPSEADLRLVGKLLHGALSSHIESARADDSR